MNLNQQVIELNDSAGVDQYFKEQNERFVRDKNRSSFENIEIRLQRKKLSLELESDQSKNFDPTSLMQ
jgi:hypothetical protein